MLDLPLPFSSLIGIFLHLLFFLFSNGLTDKITIKTCKMVKSEGVLYVIYLSDLNFGLGFSELI